ncbi:YwaF family protein [Lactococcus termiticola]|uniref:Integral membrane protein n=1 Tax=Lactococcus termiticola TaxID=2169526 RepID=A0A2R5HJD8_9LACT|nr:YwaF family protein [Lactococcus termiticola]GBG96341.1 hypothetical protein NtB2_00452 [Lactococcus termiticola]
MNYFFISNDFATGPGFGMFSPTHLLTLLFLAFVGFFIIRNYVKSERSNRKTIRRTIAVIIVSLEVIKDIALLSTGQFTLGNFPFQLCGLGIFFVLWDAFKPTRTSQALLYSLTLPGALMAELTPDWVTNHFINLFVWQSFLIHCLLISYVLCQLISRELLPDFRELRLVLGVMVVIVPIVWVLNQLWATNFFFLEIPVAGSPLMPVHDIFGNFYILGMILLVLLFWMVMYLPWELAKTMRKASKI